MMGINEWVGELADDAKKSFRMNKMLWEHDLIKKRVTCASTQKMMISWMLYHYMLQVVFIRKVLQKILPRLYLAIYIKVSSQEYWYLRMEEFQFFHDVGQSGKFFHKLRFLTKSWEIHTDMDAEGAPRRLEKDWEERWR